MADYNKHGIVVIALLFAIVLFSLFAGSYFVFGRYSKQNPLNYEPSSATLTNNPTSINSLPTPTPTPTPTSPPITSKPTQKPKSAVTPTLITSPIPSQALTNNPYPSGYYIERFPDTHIIVPKNVGYVARAILRYNGDIVKNQEGFAYNWSVDDTSFTNTNVNKTEESPGICLYGISSPCPEGDLLINPKSPDSNGHSFIRVRITKKSTGEIVAQEVFELTVL